MKSGISKSQLYVGELLDLKLRGGYYDYRRLDLDLTFFKFVYIEYIGQKNRWTKNNSRFSNPGIDINFNEFPIF